MISVSTTPDASRELRTFLEARPDTTLCHHPEWPTVIRESLGQESWFYVAHDADGTVVGAMPISRVKSLLFGDHMVSLPFLNGGGPVGSEVGKEAILATVQADARTAGVDALEVRANQVLPSDWHPTVRKITVIKELPSSAEALWKDGIRSKLRSQIRRPQKEGCIFSVGPEELEAFYRIYSTNMRDLGTPAMPRRFFESIQSLLPETVLFATVRLEGVPIAAGCGFVCRDLFEITWASALRSYNKVSPNMLLYWGLMEHVVADRGVRVFDFGRCTEGSSTHRFKRQWGTVDVPLPWLSWTKRDGSGLPTTDSPKFRLATKVWSQLPLAVANRVGPFLSSRIP